jgi:intracellular sulfur oxidation DsrE/DsrF family protein
MRKEDDMPEQKLPIARRAVLTALGTGAVVLGATSASREASAQGARWEPALDKEDDWMDLPGRHRLVFDATSANGAGDALFFASNYLAVNKSAYGLAPSELANIIILRHFATVFAYDDAMWAKYGAMLADLAQFIDPKTEEAPDRNLYDVAGYGSTLPNMGVTLSSLSEMGVHFAVCGLATQKFAELLAGQTHGDAEAIRKELSAHLVPNSRLVPAGIVAVNRTQERGYALAYTG